MLDAEGRVIHADVPGLPLQQQSYDGLGRVFQTRVGGRTRTFGYDDRDRITSVTDPFGLVHGFVYDSVGRVTERRFPDGRTMALSYDASDNLIGVTPPGRPVHSLNHNPEGQVTVYTAPNAGGGSPITQFAYDTAGRLVSVTRPDSSVVAIVYDPNGRRETTSLPGGATLVEVLDSVTGNPSGRTLTGGASLAYGYDGGFLTSTIWSGLVAGTVSQTLDADFRLATQSVNGGNSISTSYDADGLLTSAGALTIVRSPGTGFRTATALSGVQTSYSYVPGPELSTSQADFGGTTLHSATLGRDSLGRITTKTESIGGVTTQFAFVYDSAGRLAQVQRDALVAETYSYDPNGNRLQATTTFGTTTATVDAQDRLLTYGAAGFGYTTNGELRTRIVGIDTTLYTYDALGTLRSVRQPDGTLHEYLVDAEGRRVGKKVNGALLKTWLWAGPLAIVAEFDGTGQLISRFAYGDQLNVPEYMVRGGVTYRLLTDERGSVRLVVNAATGVVAQRLDYDAFGRVLLDTNAGFQPFGFAGGFYDETTALVRFGARDYDASLGRWTDKDPAGFDAGDPNLYAYVFNDPVNWIDPTGLAAALLEGAGFEARAVLANNAVKLPVYRLVRKKIANKGICYVLKLVAREVSTRAQDLLVYVARDKTGLSYAGRTISTLVRRGVHRHHAELTQLFSIVLGGGGLSLPNVEATVMDLVAQEEGFENFDKQKKAGQTRNRIKAGGGKSFACPK